MESQGVSVSRLYHGGTYRGDANARRGTDYRGLGCAYTPAQEMADHMIAVGYDQNIQPSKVADASGDVSSEARTSSGVFINPALDNTGVIECIEKRYEAARRCSRATYPECTQLGRVVSDPANTRRVLLSARVPGAPYGRKMAALRCGREGGRCHHTHPLCCRAILVCVSRCGAALRC